MDDLRLTALSNWLATLPISVQKITPLSGDASFRRYFRVTTDNGSYMAMDAPPARERCDAFVQIAQDFEQLHVNTPEIHAQDLAQGFLLLSDFGDTLLNDLLTADNASYWYPLCFDTLLKLQRHTQLPNHTLTPYNNKLYSFYEESSWFLTWYLQQYCQISLSHQDLAQLERVLHTIAQSALEQPQVIIHRDYHSRNIMVIDDRALGILDFQDSVIGPITYDAVSLLRDCYIDWPQKSVISWLHDYHQRLCDESILNQVEFETFRRWFDWIGLQRHLKCAGLFVRLKLRDNKPGYLQYLPRVTGYLRQVAEQYPEFDLLHSLLTDTKASRVAL